MRDFCGALAAHPIIAAARDMEGVRRAAASGVEAVFVLGGSILSLSDMAACSREGGKRVFVHLDLVEGLANDAAAVEYLARRVAPDGLISTRAPLLKRASALGMITIQRLFVMDSSSLAHGEKLLKSAAPDLIEVLPGLVYKAIKRLRASLDRPVIAGGMITTALEARLALAAGALAVSTSEQTLWNEDLSGVAR